MLTLNLLVEDVNDDLPQSTGSGSGGQCRDWLELSHHLCKFAIADLL